ncbi:MAG: Leucine-, isoleucine-, valine-, threonine-, and alanine-binding protein precursor [Firmicutes bacterium ADurb.Bin506]|jgi:branched-chain amino acid transport system substrate-binding protein|nr:MAG: Leucine-, isoleucine-, valine-, threonine-, and alanine-binding protein precursor [Firmicutes bacterium ADurb.Bin506]
MRKRFLLGILVLAILSASMVSMAAPVYKIAVVAPFTGSGSILGDYIRNAFIMAVEEINAKGGVRGRQIEYVIYDDAAAPATAINVVNKAILNDKVDAMFGPNMSSCVLAVHDIAKANKVPMLVGATSPSFGFDKVGNEWLFRLRADDEVKVVNLVKYAVDNLGVKKPAIIFGSTDYCVVAKDVAVDEFAKRGIKPVSMQQIKEGEKDATGQLLNIRQAAPDALIGLTHEPEAAVIMRQFRQLGFRDVDVLGFSAWGVPAFTDLAGAAADGVISVQGFTPEYQDPKVQEFVQKYQARWKSLPSDPAQAYYDGMYLLANVIEKVGFEKEDIRKGLTELKDFPGVQGPLTCDAKHNFTNFSLISQFKSGTWNIITAIR